MKYCLLLVLSVCCAYCFAQSPVLDPIAGLSANCIGTPATYSVSATNNPTGYSWSVSPSTAQLNGPVNSSSLSVSYQTAGTYTLTCTAMNGSGNSNAVQMVVTVFAVPNVNFSGSNTFCQGSSTNLSASSTVLQGSPTISYSWAPPTGLNTTTGQHVIANPSTATNYTVTATNGACTKTGTITVTPFEQLSVTFSGANTFCQGSSTNLSASSTVYQASPTISYNWLPAYGLNTINGANVIANPANATTYTVTAHYGSCSNTGILTVTPITLSVTAWGANNVCQGQSTALSASATVSQGSPTMFYSSSSNPAIVPGSGDSSTLTIVGSANTTYSLNGSPTSTVIVVTPTVTTSYTFTSGNPSGCNYSYVYTQYVGYVTGVESINNAATDTYFKVFPNPNNGVFNIRSATTETVRILNELGEIVKVIELSPDTDEQVSGLSSGIYLISTGKTKVRVVVTQ